MDIEGLWNRLYYSPAGLNKKNLRTFAKAAFGALGERSAAIARAGGLENVALTRAKNQLILIGKKSNFEKQDKSTFLQKLASEIKTESPSFLKMWND